MEVRTAKSAGFCFGVKRAVDKAYELAEHKKKTIYTLGPIIHNEEVIADLEERGVFISESPDKIPKPQNSIAIIRSHGVGKAVYEQLEQLGIEYVDVTCPFVLKIHKIVEKESRQGSQIVIMGNKDHPEVQGICGWCHTPAVVIETKREAEEFELKSDQKICIVSQTTFNYNKFQDLVEILEKKRYDRIVLNTICSATQERQSEAKIIAGSVDTMLVIGGRNSSNTQKLYEICKKECENTYYIQTLVDLDSEMFQFSSYVGITAGASTPNKIIEEVQEHVRNEF